MSRAARHTSESPQAPLESVTEALGSSVVAGILGVHARTLQRRRVSAHGPRPLEIQRAEKLGRIWSGLTRLFTKEDALLWLRIANPVLANRPPLDVMTDDGGLDRVLDVIGQLEWGIAS
ncbi:MAG TPA: antitoxin Xre/MbcA/ParS toxin-binding domain-containing protein [Bryobacteraceae bacterium]|nr:antitoxin Xre/MbcA/ParS toxin-binding domain-containing protein [Bryobacteraceae bacterium]